MADPVSYLAIERGWEVVAVDGSELGRVSEVVADEEKDIFSGVDVSLGLLKGVRHVPSESVGEIVEGVVRLTISRDEFARLGSS